MTHHQALLICQDLRIWIAHEYLCQMPFQGLETELLLIVDKKIVGCKVYMTHQAISDFSLDSHVPVCIYQIDLSDRNSRSMEDFLIMPILYSPRFNMQLIFSAGLQCEWQCCKYQWSITVNLWPLTTHTYHVIIVTGSFSEKSFYY